MAVTIAKKQCCRAEQLSKNPCLICDQISVGNLKLFRTPGSTIITFAFVEKSRHFSDWSATHVDLHRLTGDPHTAIKIPALWAALSL